MRPERLARPCFLAEVQVATFEPDVLRKREGRSTDKLAVTIAELFASRRKIQTNGLNETKSPIKINTLILNDL
jgi:hypothetical protein